MGCGQLADPGHVTHQTSLARGLSVYPAALTQSGTSLVVDPNYYPHHQSCSNKFRPSPSDSPCKYQYAMVTSIRASLKLGTRTSIGVVPYKLERNQWFLDILIDSESDRGDLLKSGLERAGHKK